jgi:hypothetical protein
MVLMRGTRSRPEIVTDGAQELQAGMRCGQPNNRSVPPLSYQQLLSLFERDDASGVADE